MYACRPLTERNLVPLFAIFPLSSQLSKMRVHPFPCRLECVFMEQMMDENIDQNDIKNPYEPPPDTGKLGTPMVYDSPLNNSAAPSLKAVRTLLDEEEKKKEAARAASRRQSTRMSKKRTHDDLQAEDALSDEYRLTQLYLDGLDIQRDQYVACKLMKVCLLMY